MANFVNEFAFFYKRRGARTVQDVLWDDVVGVTVPATNAWRMTFDDYADSVGSLDLTEHGSGMNVLATTPGPGFSGTATLFPGNAAAYLDASDAGFPSFRDDRSFGGWARFDSHSADLDVAVSYGTVNIGQAFYLYRSAANDLVFDKYGGAEPSTANPVPVGEWLHLALTIEDNEDYNTVTAILYLNGVEVSRIDDLTVIVTAPSVGLRFGLGVDGGGPIRGALCDWVFYSGVWSPSHLAALYNSGVRLI